MRRLARFLGLALAAAARPPWAEAQTGPQANLVLTLTAGVVEGVDLWAIPRQPFCPVYSGGSCVAEDTLRLARRQSASLALGIAASYFPGPTIGIQGEVMYLGLSLDGACSVLNASPTRTTTQVCGDIAAMSQTTGAISFSGSVVARVTPRRIISPFVRAGVGIVAFDHSTIDMAGSDSAGSTYQVVLDRNPRRLAPSFQLGAGLAMRVGRGYEFRLEGQDVIAAFERVVGPTNALLVPPTDTRWFHHFALTLGLGVVLEQKRGRRY